MSAIFHRVSVRKFKDMPVESEKVEKILRAAMAAPSAKNQQPWEFYVVTNREKILALSKATLYTMSAKYAPLVFVPCYRTEGKAPSYFEIDLSAAVENMLLQADELGLGTCWMGIAPIRDRMDVVREIIDLPEGLEPFCLVTCGYPEKEKEQEDRYDEKRIHFLR